MWLFKVAISAVFGAVAGSIWRFRGTGEVGLKLCACGWMLQPFCACLRCILLVYSVFCSLAEYIPMYFLPGTAHLHSPGPLTAQSDHREPNRNSQNTLPPPRAPFMVGSMPPGHARSGLTGGRIAPPRADWRASTAVAPLPRAAYISARPPGAEPQQPEHPIAPPGPRLWWCRCPSDMPDLGSVEGRNSPPGADW